MHRSAFPGHADCRKIEASLVYRISEQKKNQAKEKAEREQARNLETVRLEEE